MCTCVCSVHSVATHLMMLNGCSFGKLYAFYIKMTINGWEYCLPLKTYSCMRQFFFKYSIVIHYNFIKSKKFYKSFESVLNYVLCVGHKLLPLNAPVSCCFRYIQPMDLLHACMCVVCFFFVFTFYFHCLVAHECGCFVYFSHLNIKQFDRITTA